MKALPHPSITGLASLAILGGFINSKSGYTATVAGKESVTRWLAKGNLDSAGVRLVENLRSLVITPGGRKVVIASVGIATGGAILRKMIPRVKIGTQKAYLTI